MEKLKEKREREIARRSACMYITRAGHGFLLPYLPCAGLAGWVISRIVSVELRTRLLWPAMALAAGGAGVCAKCL